MLVIIQVVYYDTNIKEIGCNCNILVLEMYIPSYLTQQETCWVLGENITMNNEQI